MKWHKGNPNTDTENTLCVVNRVFKEEENDTDTQSPYHIAIWKKSKQQFFFQENQALFIEPDEIKRWAYIEEDDDIIEEMDALTAINAAVSHVSDLFSILLTDGICCGKEYRDLVGLDDLDNLKRKLSKRIIELDNHFN